MQSPVLVDLVAPEVDFHGMGPDLFYHALDMVVLVILFFEIDFELFLRLGLVLARVYRGHLLNRTVETAIKASRFLPLEPHFQTQQTSVFACLQ